MAALLNEIIAIGGTTAFEDPVTPADITAWYIEADRLFCCHVAVDDTDKIAGFQSLESDAADVEKIGYIATFARQTPLVKGVGTALFQFTRDTARELAVREISAKIRADNTPGLAYYSKMGFLDCDVVRAVPLKDGTPVDRIIKQFRL
jgi:L-amino acid N-acyltransferase YncA